MKYKEDSKKEMSINLYSVMPATIDTEHAKEASNLQSEVLRLKGFFPLSWHSLITQLDSWYISSRPIKIYTLAYVWAQFKEQ